MYIGADSTGGGRGNVPFLKVGNVPFLKVGNVPFLVGCYDIP